MFLLWKQSSIVDFSRVNQIHNQQIAYKIHQMLNSILSTSNHASKYIHENVFEPESSQKEEYHVELYFIWIFIHSWFKTNTSNYKTHLLLFENSFNVNSLLNQQVVNFFTWHDQIQVMFFVISLYG